MMGRREAGRQFICALGRTRWYRRILAGRSTAFSIEWVPRSCDLHSPQVGFDDRS